MPDQDSQIDFSRIFADVSNFATREEESLYARDVDGRLLRLEKATASDLDTDVTLTIDGCLVTVKKAVTTKDSQGNSIRDSQGRPVPRFTTIYDAAAKAFVKKPGDEHPIPTLCHKEHLPPVGVCRVCVVEVVEVTDRNRRRLVPSCLQQVSDGMIVHTIASTVDAQAAARVKAAAGTIVELLVTDHLPVFSRQSENAREIPGNELSTLANRLQISSSRFAPRSIERGHDGSSQMIEVDHDQCIMCGRCIRGCNWVKENRVIGRANKGYESAIAFDLGQAMADSTCVSCGECAISCPTGALQFTPTFLNHQRNLVRSELAAERKDGEIVTPEELAQYPLFSAIPFKFLQFNGSAVVRRLLKAGDVLCREGEYGATAFVIVRGSFKIYIAGTRGAVQTKRASGLAGLLGGLQTILQKVGGTAFLADVGAASLDEGQVLIRTAEDIILGEMTCMNRYPRSATVIAAEDCEILEIRRNVLYMLQRNEVSRGILERAYRSRALVGQLEKLPLVASLAPDVRSRAAAFLKDKVDLLSVEPGQTIFEQGDVASDFYIVKLGFVKVTQRYGQNDRVLNYLGPGNYFGEIGLLSASEEFLRKSGVDISVNSGGSSLQGKRTATCSALDHVELIRIRGSDFWQLLREFPELTEPVIANAKEILARDQVAQSRLVSAGNEDFLDQGLYLAQSLLVLDLERCTRCDECTKACSDAHDGVTRLVRDGLRFGHYLVASSCRSCMDPYCLVGCPVDAIHRNGDSLEINIEDYCIGCGLCASNCPYGNINMHGFPKVKIDPETGKKEKVVDIVDGKRLPVIQQRATTCDLCSNIGGKPRCVYACPHNAAFRMTGPELMKAVRKA
jgi:Fe-S-cluster-containing hydrogenase component 2/CRP-like cAMP-binding protein